MGPLRAAILLSFFCLSARAGECPENFGSILFSSPEEKVATKLGYLPESRHLKGVQGTKDEIQLLDREGKLIGYFQYQMLGRRLMVKSVNIGQQENQRKGLSEYLFSRALARHPETDSVTAELAHDNAGQFYKARREGLSCEDAIRTTPAYRLRTKFGFTKLLQVDCGETNEDRLGFVVGR